MCKYEIRLCADAEENLGKLAKEKKTTKEKLLSEYANFLLASAHKMKREDIEKAYAECSNLYLTWSEKGTD